MSSSVGYTSPFGPVREPESPSPSLGAAVASVVAGAFSGATVALSISVPVVAIMDNADKTLRPGEWPLLVPGGGRVNDVPR